MLLRRLLFLLLPLLLLPRTLLTSSSSIPPPPPPASLHSVRNGDCSLTRYTPWSNTVAVAVAGSPRQAVRDVVDMPVRMDHAAAHPQLPVGPALHADNATEVSPGTATVVEVRDEMINLLAKASQDKERRKAAVRTREGGRDGARTGGWACAPCVRC